MQTPSKFRVSSTIWNFPMFYFYDLRTSPSVHALLPHYHIFLKNTPCFVVFICSQSVIVRNISSGWLDSSITSPSFGALVLVMLLPFMMELNISVISFFHSSYLIDIPYKMYKSTFSQQKIEIISLFHRMIEYSKQFS